MNMKRNHKPLLLLTSILDVVSGDNDIKDDYKGNKDQDDDEDEDEEEEEEEDEDDED